MIRLSKVSETREPERYYNHILKLYLPHRGALQLKPKCFGTYQEFYKNGAVKINNENEPTTVCSVVLKNKLCFEPTDCCLDEAIDEYNLQGPLQDAWAEIAPQTEQNRLEDVKSKQCKKTYTKMKIIWLVKLSNWIIIRQKKDSQLRFSDLFI